MSDIELIFSALLGLLWLIWALAITSRLADIRSEAKQTNALLERIAIQTAPTTPASLKRTESSVGYRIPGIND